MIDTLVAANKIKAKYPHLNSSSHHKTWQRICFVPQLITGKSILEFGTGDGCCINLLAELNKFERMVSIDEKQHSKLQKLSNEVEFEKRIFRNTKFKNNEFESVICMEILEHLGGQRKDESREWLGWDLSQFYDVLNEARRICTKRLIMTIPFEEEFPIYKFDQATGHKQIFDRNKIITLFPKAKFINLHHWLFIIEDNPIHREFEFSSIDKVII